MKRKLVFSMLILCFVLQNALANIDTSTTQKLLQHIIQPLDKNQIPTGFLEEYGCPLLSMATFNGTLTDSNRIDMHLWRTLYFQMQTSWAKTTSNPLPAITTANTIIKNNTGNAILIPVLLGHYNTVKPTAFSLNLLSYNSSTHQVYDVPGRSQSPYTIHSLFAAAPERKQTANGTETFVFAPDAIWNTTGKSISSFEVDFADGHGLQSVSIGVPVTVSYADTGYKQWIIKATLSDNSVLQCYSDYYVLQAATASARYIDGQKILPYWGIVNPAYGVHSGARVWINYSNLNRTNTLRKPLIVVEGYDVSTIAPRLQDNYDNSYFIQELNAPSSNFDFNHHLDNIAGYDLVFIDFNDGADDIVRNAAVVQEVINRVNTHKVNDDRFGNIRQQNVVMGLSMGGLCARYALANMTKNFPGTATETRLLITHDSPHKGANVPLGLQYMIRMMGGIQLFGYNVYDIYPDYNDALGLLDAPATQQLLLYRATGTNSFAQNTFLETTYRSMVTFTSSDPQPGYRFIATANGNECANPLFNPGKTFINLGAGVSAGLYGRLLFFRVPIVSYKLAAAVEAYALPNTGSTNKIARVYAINNLSLFGFIHIFKQLYHQTAFAPGNHVPVDGVPGSNYALLDMKALHQLTSLPVFRAQISVTLPLASFMGAYFGVSAYNSGVSYQFTFIPVGSALDVTPFNSNTFSQKYVNGSNLHYPSSAHTFIAQETNQADPTQTNNVHIAFTERNARWLYNEMENLNNNLNCSNECSNPYFIDGKTTLCTNESYSIPGLQRGATVTWSVYPAGIVNLSCTSCSSPVLTKVGNGIVTLTATLNGTCNGGTIQVQKTIQVGTPVVSWPEVVYPNTSNGCLPKGFNVSYRSFIDPLSPSGFLTWGYYEGATGGSLQIVNSGGGSGANQPIRIQNNQQYNRIYVAGENACGVGVPHIRVFEFSSQCDGGGDVEYGIIETQSITEKQQLGSVQIFPNPVLHSFTVTIPDELVGGRLILVSIQGTILKTEKLSGHKMKVDVSSLPSGVYVIEIVHNKSIFRKKIVINR